MFPAPDSATRVAPDSPQRSGPRRSAVLLVVALTVLMGTLAGCGGDEFEDRTAKVTVDGRTNTFEVDSCGLDQETVFVVGRAADGSVLQAVVGVTFAEAGGSGDGAATGAVPDPDGVPTSTGVTVGVEGSTLGAFGAEAWARRRQPGDAPGLVGSARLRGSRIQVAGQLVPLDADDLPAAGATPVDFELDARCDDTTG